MQCEISLSGVHSGRGAAAEGVDALGADGGGQADASGWEIARSGGDGIGVFLAEYFQAGVFGDLPDAAVGVSAGELGGGEVDG